MRVLEVHCFPSFASYNQRHLPYPEVTHVMALLSVLWLTNSRRRQCLTPAPPPFVRKRPSLLFIYALTNTRHRNKRQSINPSSTNEMRLSPDVPLSTPPLASGLRPKISRTLARKSTQGPSAPSPEDQANALHNNMAGPHPDDTHTIYPDRSPPPPSRDRASHHSTRQQSIETHRRGNDGLAYPPLVGSPDHEVQSGRTNRARERYYGRDRRDEKKRRRLEEQVGQQSRQAGATAVQMGVGGVPEAVSISTAGMPTLAEGSRCVIL